MTTLPKLQTALGHHGLTADDVTDVLVTHIHLDHAGAAGWWAQKGATVYVHHVGAPHLIDPAKLWRSAGRIYGAQMETLWGEVLPAPADNVVPLHDEQVVEAAGLTFRALDTPGHAWHHHVYRLGDVAFSGDAAGVRVPGSQWVSLPAPPPEFDLPAWQETLDRLQAARFETLYLTHFGSIENVHEQLALLRKTLEESAAFVRRKMQEGTGRDQLLADYTEWNRTRARAAGVPEETFTRYETANPLFMSVDGLLRYWRKREEPLEE
jgi:glyoxylase-like metal-dependent hydrolase (beta-lactamase superfamily II)